VANKYTGQKEAAEQLKLSDADPATLAAWILGGAK